MDRITKTYLETFQSEQSLGHLSSSDAFERLADYCVVCDAYDDEFNVEDVHTGGGADLGLDGIAVLVNGALVASREEVMDLLSISGSLDVTFIFIQAKSAGDFSGESISSFFDGVDEFFQERIELPANDSVNQAHELMEVIYENSVKFKNKKPSCRINYVTTGQWTSDGYLTTKINRRVEKLRETGLFSEIEFTPMGADELHASYQRSKNSVSAEFTFSNKVLLPEIPGVDEAYLGVIPASEFMKLITDSAGNIRKSLFYDNIRDFQDYNAVNVEIRQTLAEAATQGRFAVLNNGVTIVAQHLQTTRDKFTLSDYQIVNGCQTSHVLFDERGKLTDLIHIPLKIISTQDDEIISSVITATNRQTQVTTEDLYALGAFQKKLEAFLAAYPDKKKLLYERRSKQYNAQPGIEKVRIITKPQQIKAFAAMFLDDAHRSSRYYSDLQAQVGDKIFNEQHKLEPYYAAAFGFYKLEFLFRNGVLPVYYKPARYHLLMAFRYLTAGHEMPAFHANKIQKYSNVICEALWDDARVEQSFKKAIEAVDSALNGTPLTRDTVKTQGFTDAVKTVLGYPPKSRSSN
ncbi:MULTISPECIES: AIPR family protein [Streptomyces]|uniref:AIPR family protein n=2 Tax=Streptomyces TaxID=1883 RepID=A0ABU4KIG8_9ACTN|nr:AIPR family protein [Streptomyces roseolus]MDX2297594.1 AIPR family protein [Streptomyces roseolus]